MRNILFALFAVTLLISCKEDSGSVDLLDQANELANQNPEEALVLLNSIDNPEEMGTKNYMQYILTMVHSKYEAKQDIKNDTIIFQAQKYFQENEYLEQSAKASYYAGWVYYKNEQTDKAIKNFIYALADADAVQDNKIAGKASNNIGYLYFEQEMMDSAIIYFQKALEYYRSETNTEKSILKALINIGRAYDAEHKLDEAYNYFLEALQLAKKIGDQESEAIIMNNIGVVLYGKKDYLQAKEYLYGGLPKTTNTEYLLKIYLNLSTVYNYTNQLDSAQYYSNLVLKRIPEISNNKYMLKSIYKSLSYYYERIGNYKEALYYSDLENTIDKRIKDENKAKQLYEANMKINVERKEREIKESEMRFNQYLLVSALVLFLVVFFTVLIIRAMRRAYLEGLEEVESLKVEYYQRLENLFLLQNTYLDTMAKLIDVDKKARLLEAENRDQSQVISETKADIVAIKKKTREQLFTWAKGYLDAQPFMKKINLKLSDDDRLLLALCGYKYSSKETALILEVPEEIMYLRKLELRNFLEVGGLSDAEIDEILFMKDESIYF